MKRVPADEFAEHAAEYLEGTETLSIEKDGTVIGQYVPSPNGHTPNGTGSPGHTASAAELEGLEKGIDPESLAIIRRLDGLLQAVYDRTGLTEDELVELYESERRQRHSAERDS